MFADLANQEKGPERKFTLPPDEVLFGSTDAMKAVRRKIEKIAGTSMPILLQGAGGTGKEMLARWTHENSPRGPNPFIKLNCAAIPGSLLESELFGYQKGAFTGAHTTKVGRVELSEQGTLFLDDIADLDLSLQAKLLQFLQDGRFCRIGDHAERYVDTRVICSTSRSLDREVEAGKFRADLYYRINVLQVNLPPLGERRVDIPLLANYFVEQYQARFERESPPLSKDMIRLLTEMEWRGNIRELENCIARYVLLGAEEALGPERRRLSDLGRVSPVQVTADGTMPLKQIAKDAVRNTERAVILKALEASHWNRRRAAELLNISYRALIYKVREAGIPQKNSRRGNHNGSTLHGTSKPATD
jgi:two-component system response regulator AtoC